MPASPAFSSMAESNANISVISHHIEEDAANTQRAFAENNAISKHNNGTLQALNSSIDEARLARAHIGYAGLGLRPSLDPKPSPAPYAFVLNENLKEGEEERDASARHERERQAKRAVGGTFGSPVKRTAINSALLTKVTYSPDMDNAYASAGVGADADLDASASSLITSGIRRGGTLDSVIHSLEEEFTVLNNKYRTLLTSCSSTVGLGKGHRQTAKEARDADELVGVINKLHKKGEQLRKLRVGSPSMNMFNSGASAAYVENLSNTNLDTSLSVANNFPPSISMKLHTHSSANAKLQSQTNYTGSSSSSSANANTSSSSSNVPVQPKFFNPLPMSPYLKYSNQTPGRVQEMHDDVLDFERQDLNATSLASDSPAARG